MNKKILITINDVQEFFKTFNKDVFAFDTETTALEFDKMEIEGISFCDGTNACYIDLTYGTQENIINYIKNLFINAKIIFAQNIVFDLKMLFKLGIHPTCELYDTMVADHLINETNSHGLKEMATRYLGVETKSYTQVSKDRRSREFYEYALNDAIWTYQIAQMQKSKLQEEGLEKLFREIEMPFQYVLLEIATTGVLIDKEKINKTTIELVKKFEELQIEMLHYLNENYQMQFTLDGGSKIISKTNFNSSQQLSDILFNRLGLKPVETTPGGVASVGKKTLEHYKTHDFVKILNKYKIVSKLYNAFFSPLPDFIQSDGRIRPNFRDTGTKTGRISCSNPNLQQLPKINKEMPIDTRECFIVPKGYKMIACDFSAQELRVLTELSQEPVLIDTFNKGKDLHLTTANDFFDLNIPEEDLYETSPNLDKWKKQYKKERDRAKIINFSIVYGKGTYGFSKDFGITEEEAQKILDKYFTSLPGVKKAIDKCHAQVKTTGFVSTMTGRKRRFTPKISGDFKFYPGSAFRESFNFLIQGFSADMIRIAMTNVYKKRKPEWELKTLFTVHDEAVYQVKEEYALDAEKFIKDEFQNSVRFCIPVVADTSIGDNYGQVK